MSIAYVEFYRVTTGPHSLNLRLNPRPYPSFDISWVLESSYADHGIFLSRMKPPGGTIAPNSPQLNGPGNNRAVHAYLGRDDTRSGSNRPKETSQSMAVVSRSGGKLAYSRRAPGGHRRIVAATRPQMHSSRSQRPASASRAMQSRGLAGRRRPRAASIWCRCLCRVGMPAA